MMMRVELSKISDCIVCWTQFPSCFIPFILMFSFFCFLLFFSPFPSFDI